MISNDLRRDLTSEGYHTLGGTFSSSQLKTMLEDPEKFYKDYITKENPRKESTAFDLGTYFHTAILEPELIEKECAIFTGAIRRGAKWDEFKEANKGKAIITLDEKKVAERMIQAVLASPIAMSFIDGYEKELSAFVDLIVFDKKVFTLIKGKLASLETEGWFFREDIFIEDIIDFGTRLRIKVRADAISIEDGYISDLKSTTGNCKNEHQMKTKVDSYSYDLSAALYLDVFGAVLGRSMKGFIWIFASKDYGHCQTWVASENNIRIGRVKWKKAVIDLAYYVANNWEFSEELKVLDNSFFQNEWLKGELK